MISEAYWLTGRDRPALRLELSDGPLDRIVVQAGDDPNSLAVLCSPHCRRARDRCQSSRPRALRASPNASACRNALTTSGTAKARTLHSTPLAR